MCKHKNSHKTDLVDNLVNKVDSKQNKKMAAEIKLLKWDISELSGDNASIKCVLDIKQNEWTKVTEKAKKLNDITVKNTNKIDPTKFAKR